MNQNKASVMIQEKKRVIYLDILRIIAVICTIAIHVSVQNIEQVEIGSYEWNMFNLYSGMVRVAVPLFVMISGALFLNPNKEITITGIYHKNILKLLSVFVFWSFIYVISYYNQYEGDIYVCISHFFTGHYHMWFLVMIIGLYMITPILRKIIESENITQYFLILTFLFTFVLPEVLKWLKVSFLAEIKGNMQFFLTEGYVGYFVAGYYFSQKNIDKWKKNVVYVLGVVGTIVMIVGTMMISNDRDNMYMDLYSSFSLTVLFECVAIFVLVKSICSNKQLREKTKKAIAFMARYSLGIYMIHILVMRLYQVTGFTTMTCNAMISVPVLVICVYGLSLVLAVCMGRIPCLKRFVS